MSEVQDERVRALNTKPLRDGGEYVLYWSQMNRRAEYNHALAYAIELANCLELPVVFYEGLDCAYPYANDRIHTFLLEGVPDTAERLRSRGIGYAFYLRKRRQEPNDIVYRLSRKAAAVVTDDFPTFVAASHNASVPEKIESPYFVVDSSCVVPMNRLEKREWAAYTIRPKIRKLLPMYMNAFKMPRARYPWTGAVPAWHLEVERKRITYLVSTCQIDHSVKPSMTFHGGSGEALRHLQTFLRTRLRRYARERNEPSAHATSDLSPYLHFGHISSLQVAIAAREYARKRSLVADEFLEELIVRRELAFNFTRHTPNYDSLACLPDWARKSLQRHTSDPREPTFTSEQMERAETYDGLWNATQKELLLRGKIHGYYRMYWGKKIIEWAETHEEALRIMLYLHDKYALDGRDPNTYANILWCFGLHDRPWKERPIFGQVRYMSYEGMRRKTDTDAYLREIEKLEKMA